MKTGPLRILRVLLFVLAPLAQTITIAEIAVDGAEDVYHLQLSADLFGYLDAKRTKCPSELEPYGRVSLADCAVVDLGYDELQKAMKPFFKRRKAELRYSSKKRAWDEKGQDRRLRLPAIGLNLVFRSADGVLVVLPRKSCLLAARERPDLTLAQAYGVTKPVRSHYVSPRFPKEARAGTTRALEQWRYEPATQGGQPIDCVLDVVVSWSRQTRDGSLGR